MNISFYILLISNFLFFLFTKFYPIIFFEYEAPIALFLIAFFGVPHGAIDHLLFIKKTNKNKVYFYTFYLMLLFIYGFSWIFLPLICFSIFLILSAYHFGQSQFEKHKIFPVTKKLIALNWGVIVLSILIVFNFEEIQITLANYDDLNIFISLFNLKLFQLLGIISTISFILLGLFSMNYKLLIKELIYISLIGITFLIQPLLMGFALFFIFNHSYTVIQSEYRFLSTFHLHYNPKKFIKALIPFTLLSILGTLFLYYLSSKGWINLSLPYIILITISSLTFPHAVVMEVYYAKR